MRSFCAFSMSLTIQGWFYLGGGSGVPASVTFQGMDVTWQGDSAVTFGEAA